MNLRCMKNSKKANILGLCKHWEEWYEMRVGGGSQTQITCDLL